MRTVVTGPVAADEVWERYARPERWPGWSPQIRAVHASADRIAPGVTGTVHGPAGLAVSFTVTAVDEPARTWTWEVRVGPVRLELGHGVEATGSGSSTWLDVRGPLPVVLAYLPAARLALTRLVRMRDVG